MKKNIRKVFSFLASSVLRPTSVGLFISRLLDPMWVVPAVTILGAYESGLHNFTLWRIIVILALVMVAPPLLLRWRFTREKGSSGWDIKNRAHRPKALGAFLVFGLLNVMLAWVFGNPTFGRLFIFYELWLAGFFLISLVWKISGHAGGIALATGLVIQWFGWTWWPVLLLVPWTAWARVVTKNHTVWQVMAGALYSWGLIWLWNLLSSLL
ncbi:hypothetical protein HY411_01665 [Candidatus Gottesmanbacteria bacterium]|nr:hypothetical protein [Candidatus Gottesmanbacteria bacterium]